MRIIITVALFVIVWGLPFMLVKDYVKDHNKRIGKTYILVKDTVTIVDFNVWNGTYVGDNGKNYSRIFVEAVEELDEMKKITK